MLMVCFFRGFNSKFERIKMNMKKYFMAMLTTMFGFGTTTPQAERGKFKKPDRNQARLGSINSDMKEERDHSHGTLGRRIARTVVKAIKAEYKREARVADRKRSPGERALRFA